MSIKNKDLVQTFLILNHEMDETPQHFIGDCPAYINTRISHFGHHKIELADLVKYDKTFKLASFVQKTKRLEKF